MQAGVFRLGEGAEFFQKLHFRIPHSVLIRNGIVRNTSEIFGFFKKRLMKFSKARNPPA